MLEEKPTNTFDEELLFVSLHRRVFLITELHFYSRSVFYFIYYASVSKFLFLHQTLEAFDATHSAFELADGIYSSNQMFVAHIHTMFSHREIEKV